MEIILFYLVLEAIGWAATCFLQAARLLTGGGKPWWKHDRLYFGPALALAVMAAVQIGTGIAQKAKAAKLARNNKRPPLEDNPYTDQAYDLTGSRAQQGLGDATMQAYNTGNDRALASSINGILKSGGSSNNIASLYEGQQTGLRTMALANEEAKMKNIQQFLTAGLDKKADEDRDKWYLNKYVPFKDMAQLSAAMSEQGMSNIWKGVNTGFNALTSYTPDQPPATQGASMAGRPLSATAGTPLATPYSQRVSGSAGMPGGQISANVMGGLPSSLNVQGQQPSPYIMAPPAGYAPRWQFDARSNQWIQVY